MPNKMAGQVAAFLPRRSLVLPLASEGIPVGPTGKRRIRQKQGAKGRIKSGCGKTLPGQRVGKTLLRLGTQPACVHNLCNCHERPFNG